MLMSGAGLKRELCILPRVPADRASTNKWMAEGMAGKSNENFTIQIMMMITEKKTRKKTTTLCFIIILFQF